MVADVAYSNDPFIAKHRDIYIFYSLLIKHLGEKARNMKRKDLYNIVSQHFYIAPNMVTRIINRMARFRYVPNKIEIEEYKDRVTQLKKVIGCLIY